MFVLPLIYYDAVLLIFLHTHFSLLCPEDVGLEICGGFRIFSQGILFSVDLLVDKSREVKTR